MDESVNRFEMADATVTSLGKPWRVAAVFPCAAAPAHRDGR